MSPPCRELGRPSAAGLTLIGLAVDALSRAESGVCGLSGPLRQASRSLLGIDAPEIASGTKSGQPFGEEARDYLDHLIGGKTIRVDAYGPDQYKRVLGVLWDDQVNVNLLMVAMGYAEVFRGKPCRAHCRELDQAETTARRDRVGMWAQGAQYESPAAFRRRLRIQGE